MEGRDGAGLATAPDPGDRIAYDQCYPTWSGRFCDLHVRIGATDTVISTSPEYPAQPSWAPDGSRIAFVSGDIADIAVVEVATGLVTSLTTGPATDFGPQWSPDGSQIAFMSSAPWEASWNLYVMNADGSNLRGLTSADHGFDFSFNWSPDGDVIAFAGHAGAVPALYLVNADGSNPSPIAGATGFTGEPSWSPDGTRIVFDCVIESGNDDICTISPTGSDFARLTSDPASERGGILSPRDGRLAFVTTQFGDSEIAVLAPDGALTRVAGGTPGRSPRWSPEGTRLIFTGATPTAWVGTCYFGEGAHNADDICEPAYEIYVADADGTGVALFATGDNPDWSAGNPPANSPPVASFTLSCSGRTCNVDASGSSDADGGVANYAWSFGDGSVASGVTADHTYGLSGGYTITLTIRDDAGATGTTSQPVSIVNAAPVAMLSSVCDSLTCSVDGSSSRDADGAVVSHAWAFGDGPTASGQTATHTYPGPGTYTIALTVTDNEGATSTATQNVTVARPRLHVGDLDGANQKKTGSWTSMVTVTVHDSSEAVIGGATVTGSWSTGASGTCTTSPSGTCSITLTALSNKIATVAFTVGTVTHSRFDYRAAANHDPDGDSSGTIITVKRP